MPTNRRYRLVVDTNLWISFLISHRFDRLEQLAFKNRVLFLFSRELLHEIDQTGNKPKLRKYFGVDAIQQMLTNLKNFIEIVDVKSQVKACRDPKDDFLLALAKDGHADFLLTGDKILLELQSFGPVGIITLTSFLEKMGLEEDT